MRSLLFKALVGAMLLAGCKVTLAVPSFARQTGFECTTCHLSWPELTSVGRQFKLGGYTLMRETTGERPWLPTSGDGPPPKLPFAAMVQGSLTRTSGTSGTDSANFPRNDGIVLQQLSALYAGRIVDHLGAFVQWTYDGIAHHSSVDNVDIRAAGHWEGKGLDLSYGVTVNNNPTVSDVYNTTPAWGFPYASSSVAVAPNASTLIDGGLAQQVAGVGVYTMWSRTVYAEIAGYGTAVGALSMFRAGTDKTTDAVLEGTAPYWRLALQHAWDGGVHSAMLGTYGIVTRKSPSGLDPTGRTDRYRDIGVDAQYQYVIDRHRLSAQLNWIAEKQDLEATVATGGAINPTDTLRTFKAKATYYYDRKYGATIQYFRTTGSVDAGLYDTGQPVMGSATGSPRSSGLVAEIDWLPRRDLRLMLQYTAYQTFNGASSNYDGFGRDAKDNNTLYVVAWLMI